MPGVGVDLIYSLLIMFTKLILFLCLYSDLIIFVLLLIHCPEVQSWLRKRSQGVEERLTYDSSCDTC